MGEPMTHSIFGHTPNGREIREIPVTAKTSAFGSIFANMGIGAKND